MKYELSSQYSDNVFSGGNVKTADSRNVLPNSIAKKRYIRTRHKLSIVTLITVLFSFAVASQVSGSPTEMQEPLQSQASGHIDLDKIFFINNSVAAADAPVSHPSDRQPTAKTTEDDSTAMDIFMDGVDALDMENFEEAARLFKKASIMEPQNLEHQYYLAVAYVRIKKNREALEIFESLTAKDPKIYFKAYFDIAAIYSSEKKYEKAIATLQKAGEIDPKSGRVFLDMGYAYKDSGNYGKAIKSFSRAKELDPQLNQISVYMTGATYLEEEQFDQAAQKFKEALELDPETPLAESARQTIPRVEEAAWGRKPWYLITSFNWGYDDNVARDPLNEVIGGPTTGGTGKGDQYQTFFLRTGYKFLNLKDYEAGVGYTLFSLGYRDWTQANVTSHSPHAYFQADWDPVFFRFQYDFSYFYSGGEKQGINPPIYLTFANNSYARLRMHSFMPTISILEPYDLRTDINLIYQIKDYLDGVTGDSTRYAGDITQSYQIPGTQCLPRIGYRTAYEPSGDDPSTYSYHELMAGVAANIYWDIWGDLSFAYMRTHYPDFTPTEDRRDSTYTTTFSLKRYLMDRLLLTFLFIHMKNDSDYVPNSGEDFYTFEKNIYSLEITYVF
jgi:tetratricopeptide (TPR) repeat protein